MEMQATAHALARQTPMTLTSTRTTPIPAPPPRQAGTFALGRRRASPITTPDAARRGRFVSRRPPLQRGARSTRNGSRSCAGSCRATAMARATGQCAARGRGRGLAGRAGRVDHSFRRGRRAPGAPVRRLPRDAGARGPRRVLLGHRAPVALDTRQPRRRPAAGDDDAALGPGLPRGPEGAAGPGGMGPGRTAAVGVETVAAPGRRPDRRRRVHTTAWPWTRPPSCSTSSAST
jgi:hypothetical protein